MQVAKQAKMQVAKQVKMQVAKQVRMQAAKQVRMQAAKQVRIEPRNTAECSREAAKESSLRRKPWVPCSSSNQAPEGRKNKLRMRA